MLIKSILTVFRQLYRNPGAGILNIASLAIGITTFTLLLFYIQKEKSYDAYHHDADRLYRVVNEYRIEKDQNTTAWTAPALASLVQGQVPGLVEAVRLFKYRSPVVMVDREAHKNFTEPNSVWADANVFNVFTFDFLTGNPDLALAKPNSMVITESMAIKYFGTTDVIGKVLSDITMNADFQVTAVVRDMPETSHLKADFLCSLSTLPSLWGADILNSGNNSFLYTYLKVDGASADVESAINELARKQFSANEQYSFHLALQPVRDIHLHSNVLNEWQANSDIRYIYILAAVAALILIVSCINYVNLWIARSERRTKEIGIRQAIGGSKFNLGVQFTIESMIQVLMALILSVGLVGVSMPWIREMLGENLLLPGTSQLTIWLYVFLGMVGLMFLVMLYPATIIGRIRPALAIKGRTTSRAGLNLWEGLIGFQILVTACLITGTVFINRQVSFMRDQSPGYDIDHIISISQMSNSAIRNRLKEALLANADIKSASGVSHLPGGMLYQQGYDIIVNGKKETFLWQRIHVDHDFCKTFGIEIVAGRDFSANVASDSANYIINETAAGILGLKPESAVGIEVNDHHGKVIGVMRDFHFKTLHSTIEPLIVHIVPDRIRMLTVNIGNSDPVSAVRPIAELWKKLQPEEPFVYTTLNGFNSQNYSFEVKFAKVVLFFTLIVVLLSASGLISLNIYISNLRKKEIGVRRILGANTMSLLMELSKRFAVITTIGFVASLPLSRYALSTWLNGFAYRVELGAGIFFIVGLITFILSMISIALPSLQTARQNAATVLRSGE